MFVILVTLLGFPQEWDPQKYPWPMFAQNSRRTAQSPHRGPTTVGRRWSYVAAAGASINLQPVVTDRGVYFGTWGLTRRDKGETPDQWEKSDGRYFALSLEKGEELFSPLLPGHVPVGYLYPGRKRLPRDVFLCGKDHDYLASFYNGTIEGTACVDPESGIHYVGRGDGKLYAIDAARGKVLWSFATFNPEDPKDPDGGGEIVGGPVLGSDGLLYFGTVGVPWPEKSSDPSHETHAVYAVDRSGKLVWRYPSTQARLPNWVYTPPALSPNGKTLYFATLAGNAAVPGGLYALDLTQPPDASDEKRLRWLLELRNPDRPLKPHVYARSIAVGADGRLYCAGYQAQLLGSSPAVFAVDPKGTFAWKPAIAEPQGYPSKTGHLCGGIALQETKGIVNYVVVTTTHVRNVNGEGGALFVFDPETGRNPHSFDPSTRGGIGGMTPPIVDADGIIYAGIRGKHAGIGKGFVGGRMYGIEFFPARGFRVLWEHPVEEQLDWAAPAIGANGALYFGSTAPMPLALQMHFFNKKEIPPNTSPHFTALFRD